MRQEMFTITQNGRIARDVFRMRLVGAHGITAPGQFVQIKIDGLYLRRPISVCDYDATGFTIIYKVVGSGTAALSAMLPDASLDILTGLGNGYRTEFAERPLLIGGGGGVPPLYALAKAFRAVDKPVSVILGFNDAEDVFYVEAFKALGCSVQVATVNPSQYHQGFVTDLVKNAADYDYFYACGPEPMLKAVYHTCATSGQFSFESRMACGFGACMGCSCKTKYGSLRICKDGPVLHKEVIVW